MSGPLASLHVVEFCGLGPGPLAGQLLADLGAQVTVIDKCSAAQDPNDINRRGKQSIALDLKTEAGHAVAQAVIRQSDILIEGFRPGVMERLALGPQDCPDTLIYGRMTGWGQSGPLAMRAGHDLTYLAVSGVLSMIGPRDAPPVPPLNLVADYGGGAMMLIFGILAAVVERQITGKGQVVDAAMVDGVPALMGLIHGMIASGRWGPERGANWLDGGAPFYRCYTCEDGRHIAVAALEPQFYAELLAGLGLDPADLPDQNDATHWPQMQARFETIFASAPMAEWAERFDGTDACVAPVLTLQEAAAHPHLAQRGTYVSDDVPLQAGVAPRLSHWPARMPAAPGAAGGDADAILTRLGYAPDQIAALRADRVLT
ncbi:MAG: CaiB/BaiF CoA-transferase family protein [Pseudomonadota bacterium]